MATLTLSPEVQAILRQLAQDASDTIGRGIGASAIVRALARWAGTQGPRWASQELFPHIEAELSSGVTWGAIRKGGKKQ